MTVRRRSEFLTLSFLACAGLAGCSSRTDLQDEVDRICENSIVRYGVVVRDRTAVVAAKNADSVFPAASLAKLGIGLAAVKRFGTGSDAMSKRLSVTASDLQASSPRLRDAVPGSEYPFGQLLSLMLQQSDNLAANILISHLGVPRVNDCFAAIGAKTTRINGLYTDSVSARSSATTTPGDLSTLLHALLAAMRGDVRMPDSDLSAAGSELVVDMLASQTDNSMIRAGLPAGVQVSDKTGVLARFIGDAAIIDALSPAPVIVVILADMAAASARDLPLQRAAAIRAIHRIAFISYGRLGSFAF